LSNLLDEFRRRSVWQVLGVYLVGSWIALQVVDVLANNFGLPEWFPAFALALLVIGLPIVLATAMAQGGLPSRSDPATEPDGQGDAGAEGPPASGTATATFLTWRNALAGGVAAFALLGVVTFGWWIFGGSSPPAPEVVAGADAAGAEDLRSVAVLPFVTRSALDEDLFFADGMHDDLLTQLSKIEALTVISRTSVERYRATDTPIPVIADELGVAVIVEGAIQRAGSRVRVNMQLIEADTDKHLWAETYDEELTAENLFRIQSDLAQKIAASLQATLSPQVVERITTPPTNSVEAFEVYSRGRYLYHRSNPMSGDGLREALALFEQAVALDSTYALAWAGVADAYDYGGGSTFTREEAQQAWPAVERALELDPNLAEALSRRGFMHLNTGREEEAERDFERAIELSPGSALVVSRYGGFLSRTGRMDPALENARKAVQIDPLNLGVRANLEDLLWRAGEFEEASEESRRTLSMDPTYGNSWYNLGWTEGMLNRHDEAIRAFQEAIRVDGEGAGVEAALAWALARAGRHDEALALVEEIDASSAGSDAALVYFELGDLDTAYEVLEGVLRANPAQVQSIAGDWSAAGMREHPRYAEVLERLGLDEG
jgi:TolB-like protein/Tfp pilus assembly protein PilF